MAVHSGIDFISKKRIIKTVNKERVVSRSPKESGTVAEILVGALCGLLFLALIALVVVIPIIRVSTASTATFTVEKMERVTEGRSSSRYLVFTDKGVFENTDELLKGKFNSSDLYGSMKVGKTYTCDVVGWRVQFLSWYPNLITCDEVR